jgi:predicted peptidase
MARRALFLAALGLMGAASASSAAGFSIKDVSGIARSFGDGEKVAAAVVEYTQGLDQATVSASDYSVEGREVAGAAVSSDGSTPSASGRFVIVSLTSPNTAFDGDLSKRPGAKPRQDKGADAPTKSDRKAPDLSFTLRQIGGVRSSSGEVLAGSDKAFKSSGTSDPVLESFTQHVYTDPTTGLKMPYNLFLPKGYTPSKRYPMVVFIADASADIDDVKAPLYQGNGATVFAEEEFQKDHECIVLAPQYTHEMIEKTGMLTTDKNEWTPGLELLSHLVFSVASDAGADFNRIYGTGQSQGGMANIAISDRYPDFFAAQYLVACQWNTDEMKALASKKLWITVCEGDTKAYPGMNEAVSKWEAMGAKVARSGVMWDPKAPASDIEARVKELLSKGAGINYAVFKGGNHMYTWSFAYGIRPVLDWMFAQSRDGRGKHRNEEARTDMRRGMNAEESGDYQEALTLYEKAAAEGDFKAPRHLGQMYEKGLGVKADPKRAAELYLKAASNGDITASCLLGDLYLRGLGVEKDPVRARALYEASAQRRDVIAAPAMVALGMMHEQGIGMPKDQAAADELYAAAARTGLDVEAQKASRKF